MLTYDPDEAPDPQQWLALDEARRNALVLDYHERAGIELPSPVGHAAAHVAVESQLALGDPPIIRETLARLMGGGLDRHDAVHAIAAELMSLISAFMTKEPGSEDINRRYAARLAQLTAASWHGGSGKPD